MGKGKDTECGMYTSPRGYNKQALNSQLSTSKSYMETL